MQIKNASCSLSIEHSPIAPKIFESFTRSNLLCTPSAGHVQLFRYTCGNHVVMKLYTFKFSRPYGSYHENRAFSLYFFGFTQVRRRNKYRRGKAEADTHPLSAIRDRRCIFSFQKFEIFIRKESLKFLEGKFWKFHLSEFNQV